MSTGTEEITWDMVRQGLREISKKDENWAGCPLPITGIKLVIEPRYPNQGLNGFALEREKDEEYEAVMDRKYDSKEKAHFIRYHPGKKEHLGVQIGEDGKLRVVWRLPHTQHQAALTRLMDTMLASQAWDHNAEVKAQEKLFSLVSGHQFVQYSMTGAFVERSKRSQVLYVFRRCGTTLALRHDADFSIRVLAALCLHPVGYYEQTHAGCLVPTDDVIAHLLMVRGAEHKFWAQANHHTPEDSLGY